MKPQHLVVCVAVLVSPLHFVLMPCPSALALCSLLAKLFPSIAYMNEREMNYSLTGYDVVDEVVKSARYKIAL